MGVDPELDLRHVSLEQPVNRHLCAYGRNLTALDSEIGSQKDSEIDKELEDKISRDFSAYETDIQSPKTVEESMVPLLIVALILATLALITFLALPANSSQIPPLSQSVSFPWL